MTATASGCCASTPASTRNPPSNSSTTSWSGSRSESSRSPERRVRPDPDPPLEDRPGRQRRNCPVSEFASLALESIKPPDAVPDGLVFGFSADTVNRRLKSAARHARIDHAESPPTRRASAWPRTSPPQASTWPKSWSQAAGAPPHWSPYAPGASPPPTPPSPNTSEPDNPSTACYHPTTPAPHPKPHSPPPKHPQPANSVIWALYLESGTQRIGFSRIVFTAQIGQLPPISRA